MNSDNYVTDELRGKAWGDAYAAMQWYRDELARVEASMGWQPIETAPKDGTAFFAASSWRDRDGNIHWDYSVCWWERDGWSDGEPVGPLPAPSHWVPVTPPSA